MDKFVLTEALNNLAGQQLQPQLWPNGSLDPRVRTKLLSLAKDFMDEYELPPDTVTDIIVTGSLANFNWNDYSDLDLHLVVDARDINCDGSITTEYFTATKSDWNEKHDIEMFGFPVEIYVQDISEPHHASGVYSLLTNNWLRKPSKTVGTKPDESLINRKADQFVARVNVAAGLLADNQLQAAMQHAMKLKDKIKRMRQTGLTKSGEYSIENLAFKRLRNDGTLERLTQIEHDAYDRLHSIMA